MIANQEHYKYKIWMKGKNSLLVEIYLYNDVYRIKKTYNQIKDLQKNNKYTVMVSFW